MDRREFLILSAFGAAGLKLGWPAMLHAAAPASARAAACARYNMIMLGDTHFDTEPETVYHANYNQKDERLNRIQRAEFVRNGEMWRDRCPRLVHRASLLRDARTKMVLHMGDLIQGDCGDPEVHKRMLSDAIDWLGGSFPGLPLVTVAGNHDIRGTEAAKAYDEYMFPQMSRQLGKTIGKTTFAFGIGDDAYITADFQRPDDAEMEKLLDDTKGARHTFIVSHGPIIPCDTGNTRWCFHGRDDEVRRHFRRLFAEREAICLCGHVHKTEFADWYGDGGRITQITMSSVWAKDRDGVLDIATQDPAEYGEFRRKSKSGEAGYVDETAFFNEYKTGLKKYVRCLGAGSYRLNVSPGHVYVDYYPGDSVAPGLRFKMR